MRIMLGLVLYSFKTKDKGERIMRFKHCPTCGQELIEREIGCEGKLPYCDGCKKPWLEMFSACIISVVVNEFDEVALLKQSNDVENNYVCVAGFIQSGENVEETAMREIKEELGLETKSLAYIKSGYYDEKGMLMLGYKAEVKKAEFNVSSEEETAEWVPFSEVLSKLRTGSTAWKLVKDVIIDTM